MEEHREAIEHDLLVETGHELRDVGRSLSWGALRSFLTHISPESALAREINPEGYIWASRAKTNALLADIYDLLSAVNANLCAKGTGKKPKQPKPYPRPGDKDRNTETRHIGKDPLPPDKLREWFKQKEQGGEVGG